MKKLFLFALALILLPVSAMAADINVPGDQPTIQAAIDAAHNGDTILIAAGTYTGPDNRNLKTKGKTLTIKSVSGPADCVIDCQGEGQGFSIPPSTRAVVHLEGLTIRNGYSGSSGGAIYADRARLEAVDCIFEGNRAVFDGGAVYATHQPASFTRCIFNNNSVAYEGGAVSASYSTFDFVNCQFSQNQASKGRGGAVYSPFDNHDYPAKIKFINCSFSRNHAKNEGGALWCYIRYPGDQVDVKNCILWDNTAQLGDQIHEDVKKPLTVTYSIIQGGRAGAGNLGADPLFVDPDNHDLHLQTGSPAIDAGTADGAPANDLAKQPRPAGSGIDIGTYEHQQAATPPYDEGQYNYYLPYYSSAGFWTGIGVTNANPDQQTQLQATVYSSAGEVIDQQTETISAHGQSSFAVGEGLNTSGWVRVNSHDPLYGLAFIGGAKAGQNNLMADVSFVNQLSRCLVIPHIAQTTAWDTVIYLCNPNDAEADINLKYVDMQGHEQKTATRKIAARGSGQYPLASLFPNLGDLEGHIEIDAGQPVAAFALYYNLKEGGLYYAGIDAEPCR